MARKKSGWFGESRRHSLASKGIRTADRRVPKPSVRPRASGRERGRYKHIDGKFLGVNNYGSIFGVVVEDSKGDQQEYFGEPRMISEAVDGMKLNDPIRINFANDWDWTLVRFDEDISPSAEVGRAQIRAEGGRSSDIFKVEGMDDEP